jgi:hypothetical protein
MRKLLLSTAAAIMLAGPALAENKMLSVNLSGVVIKNAPKGLSTIVPFTGTFVFIAVGNRVDLYQSSPPTPGIIPSFTVTVPLGTITDMVFNPAGFLTVQGAGPFAVTIDYTVFPPNVLPAAAL